MAAARAAFLRGEVFDQVEAMWHDGVVSTPAHGERAQRLSELRNDPMRMMRRRVGKLLRRAGLMR